MNDYKLNITNIIISKINFQKVKEFENFQFVLVN